MLLRWNVFAVELLYLKMKLNPSSFFNFELYLKCLLKEMQIFVFRVSRFASELTVYFVRLFSSGLHFSTKRKFLMQSDIQICIWSQTHQSGWLRYILSKRKEAIVRLNIKDNERRQESGFEETLAKGSNAWKIDKWNFFIFIITLDVGLEDFCHIETKHSIFFHRNIENLLTRRSNSHVALLRV